MTRQMRLGLLLLGLTLLCAAQAVAQPRLGGYKDLATDDNDAVAAAQYAVGTRTEGSTTVTLVSVEKAERQIVAGQNYRLRMTVTLNNGEYEATQTVMAVVFRNLKQEYSLTSWEVETGDAPAVAPTMDPNAQPTAPDGGTGSIEPGTSEPTAQPEGPAPPAEPTGDGSGPRG